MYQKYHHPNQMTAPYNQQVQYNQQVPPQQQVKFSDYVQNPFAYIGYITKVSGNIESKTDFDKPNPGSIILLVKLNVQLSGASTNEPIHIVVDGQSPYKDDCLLYIGNPTVLDFECSIMQKPPGIHWFKLEKTSWDRQGYKSNSNNRGKVQQQAQIPVPPVSANEEVSFANYIQNPNVFEGKKTSFQGKVGDSQWYNQDGVTGTTFSILLDAAKSGAMIEEPIYILVQDGNDYISEMNMQKGQSMVFQFTCQILNKPPKMHWFKLIKTSYPDSDYNSVHPNLQPKGPSPPPQQPQPYQPAINQHPQPIGPNIRPPPPAPKQVPRPQPAPQQPQTDPEKEKRIFCHLTNKIMTNPVRADDGWYYNALEINQYLQTHRNVLPTGIQQRNLTMQIDKNVQDEIIGEVQRYVRI
ncbi:MAG: hypothetical protein EZS28_012703 [Streblomastix strix]|uniref:U-box domain-containing protein n=1 Tax=Streblomastix strix TaxID=222440 RepID=A0A5J4WAH8_9EUKA|nr:MAG: hypothetical protein EZS28_012703 [Streblomastix strix]